VQPRKWQVQTTLNKLVPLQVGSAPRSAGDTFELRGYPKADRTNPRWETSWGPMLAAWGMVTVDLDSSAHGQRAWAIRSEAPTSAKDTGNAHRLSGSGWGVSPA
jgi:hypothetical protein